MLSKRSLPKAVQQDWLGLNWSNYEPYTRDALHVQQSRALVTPVHVPKGLAHHLPTPARLRGRPKSRTEIVVKFSVEIRNQLPIRLYHGGHEFPLLLLLPLLDRFRSHRKKSFVRFDDIAQSHFTGFRIECQELLRVVGLTNIK